MTPTDTLENARAVTALPPSTVASAIAAALDALARVSKNTADYRALDDSTLLELSRLASLERQLVDAHAVVIAGEIDHRSAPALGHDGLAQRSGFRTPEELLRASTRSTARDASTAIRVGRLVHEATASSEPTEPWLLALSDAITAGTLPVASADSIRSGLGVPTDSITASTLAGAAAQLCAEAATLDPDRLFRRARELRDELDQSGIADRESERRSRRSLRLRTNPDGSGELIWRFDPETAAIVTDIYDRATSPRRGGPRFVDSTLAESILADERTTEQLASDVFVQLLQQGADADDSQLLGTGAASIRVLVPVIAPAAPTPVGTATATGPSTSTLTATVTASHGFIEGQPDPISIKSVERLACSGSTLTIRVDAAGQPLDIGREHRFHNRNQRIALAARDGGCRFPGCERPPSWAEAHHVRHWARDRGGTSVADGILLCRHHHLLVHNNRWDIERSGADYWLVPPAAVDPTRTRIPMPSKSRAMRELIAGVG